MHRTIGYSIFTCSDSSSANAMASIGSIPAARKARDEPNYHFHQINNLMKIDSSLRQAILSASKAQPSYGYDDAERERKAAIATMLAKRPSAAKVVRNLRATITRSEATTAKAEKQLCEKFGLRVRSNELEFASCDESNKNFKKAGGIPPVKHQRWSFDFVMAEIAVCEPKDGARILKKYGIRWT